MRFLKNILRAPATGGLLGLLLAGVLAAQAQEPRRILVTVEKSPAEPLTAPELDLRVGKKPADILRVYQPQERPVQLALLIADEAGREVTQSLPDLARFLRSLPHGSQVLVAYVRSGNLEVAQTFTEDREAAAGALRVPSGSTSTRVVDLGQIVLDGLDFFPPAPPLRAQILYLGDAQPQSDPYQDVTLNRAIAQAQRRGVTVWTIRVQTAARPEQFGGAPRTRAQAAGEQSLSLPPTTVQDRVAGTEGTSRGVFRVASSGLSMTESAFLQRLSAETGGRAYAQETRLPSLEPFLEELRAGLDRQYLVEFAPPTDKKGEPVSGKLVVRVRGRDTSLLHPQH